jgi:hypothetical protein
VSASLPYVDEHSVEVSADAHRVWTSLVGSLDRGASRPVAAAYARLVGCADRSASGPRPFAGGSTVPGFHVVHAAPERELSLEGRHRFSTYALTFRIEEIDPERCRLTAETRAEFPGLHGRLYRLLVSGSGAHVVGVRRILAGVRRRSEAAAPASS